MEKAEKETKEIIEKEKEYKEESDTIKTHFGETHKKEREDFDKDRAAGSLLGRMKELWWTTQFLSFKDIFNVIKEIAEFMKRKHERRSKGRYGDVGSRLPWIIGPEFERVKQAAETEEVNKYKEAMEHWSIAKVKSTLYTTSSKDIVKACIMTLLHHGEMRWDDHEFHATLNRLTARYTLKGAELYIPTKAHLIKPGWSGEDLAQPAMDALWETEQLQIGFRKISANTTAIKIILNLNSNSLKMIRKVPAVRLVNVTDCLICGWKGVM